MTILNVVARHFQPSLNCFLWWFGGIITGVWSSILMLSAYGLTYKGHAPAFEHTAMYITALIFCLGVKRLRSDAPEKNDGLTGEFWYFLTLIITGILFFDYFFPNPVFLHIDTLPDQLFWTNAGTASLLTGTKVFQGWEFIKKLIEKIKKITGTAL